MIQIKVLSIIATIFTVALIVLFNSRLGVLPPMGKFLDPISGVWQLVRVSDVPEMADFHLPGLHEEVKVVFNDRAVPHIFAQNDHDLYYILGYLMARHRLWQMDFTARAAAGRLSEVLGPNAFSYDAMQRKLGVQRIARRMVEAIEYNKESFENVAAFSEGINAWIQSMPRREMPFEFQFLNYQPEPWTIEHTGYIFTSVAQMLTQQNFSVLQSSLQERFGEELPLTFYPDFLPDLEPVFPSAATSELADLSHSGLETYAKVLDLSMVPLFNRPPSIGSNNWAVSGAKTASGFPMLASDPHLALGLPSIWYESQLNAPGINVYGVSIVGSPHIAIGFNEDSAWGLTNFEANASDFYEIQFNEELTHYLYEGDWLPLEKEEQPINVRGRGEIQVETVFSHHGPIPLMPPSDVSGGRIPVGYAFRWVANDPGNPFQFFELMNRNATVEGMREAASTLRTPGLVTAFANRAGDIALQVNGLYPSRSHAASRFLLDGRVTDPDWDLPIPFEKMPFAVNPERGFVSSANQHPTKADFPFRFGWYFGGEARPRLINRSLKDREALTLEDMKAIQLNDENYRAERWLDTMLEIMANIPDPEDSQDAFRWRQGLRLLAEWDRRNSADSVAATIFNEWLIEARELLWLPLAEDHNSPLRPTPATQVTLRTLLEGYGADVYTRAAGTELSSEQILSDSYQAIIERLNQRYGPVGTNWQWWRHNGAVLYHPLRIPALSSSRLRVGGHPESPNAIVAGHGPSWRMVVELSNPIRAYGIAPGGQVANPASTGRTASVQDWAEGRYYPLELFPSADAASAVHPKFLNLQPAQ